MCWFSGTGGDRPLDQQAISLPSGRITHSWTGYMQKRNIPPFQVVSTGFSEHCSLLLSFSLLLCPHIFSFFFVCPTGNELLFLYSHLSFSCCFLVLTDRFESLLRLTVFLSFCLWLTLQWVDRVMAAVDHCSLLITVSQWWVEMTGRDKVMISSLSVIFSIQ